MADGAVVGIRGILFTDMVGSTALRQRLGDDRADRLRAEHYGLLGSAVADHRGRVLRWTGDGVQADFPTASDAVGAALDIQRAVQRYGQGGAAIAAFQVRIGLSVGEVQVHSDDDSGIAVVEAARLEAMAAAGEILATDLVERLGGRRVDAGFDDVGERRLKGLDRPVRVFRVIDTRAAISTRALPRSLSLDRRFPLVGRTAAVNEAMRAWQEARQGTTAARFVTGQSGMGKSRLLAQVADRAHGEGATVLAGTCDAELTVPYQPFARAFSDIGDEDPLLSTAVTTGEGALGALFPARRVGRFDDPGPGARFELFEAVAELLARLSSERPVLLIVEDLHWATVPTVQLLRHLLHHADETSVMIIATYRAEEVDAGHPLHDLLVEVGTSRRTGRIDLLPLTEDDVTEMVLARVPDADSGSVRHFAGRLTRESAGSPFFVCELLHHLSTTGQLATVLREGDFGQLPIPDTVRDVVGQRLGRLSDTVGEMLSTAALIGLSFDLTLVAALSGTPEELVLAPVEEAMRATLLHEVDIGQFSFSHAIVRSTLLERMSATRRALGHRRVAEAIEALGRGDHDELAYHWQQAGVEAKAVASVEQAARRDLEALAYESAAERFATVLAYRRRSTPVDQAACARALLGIGMAERGMGRAEYLTWVEQAGRLARRAHDVDVVADAALMTVWPGSFFVRASTVEWSLVEMCEDALNLLDPNDPRRIGIKSALAAHLTFDPDRSRRTALLAEAMDGARALGEPDLVASVLMSEYLSLWDPSTFERRADVARELSRIARATGDSVHEFFAGFFTAIGATERGQLVEARRRLADLEVMSLSSDNFYFMFLTLRLRLSIDIMTGKPGAQAEVDALAQRYQETYADTDGTWSVQTAGLALQAGTMHSMVGAMEALLESSTFVPNWMPAYGLALLSGGDSVAAERVLDNLQVPPLDYFWLSTVQSLAELAVGLGRVERCREILDELVPFREQLGVTASGSLCFGLVATTLGQLALAIGDHAAAVGYLEEAVRRADAMEAPYEATKSRRALAQTLAASGAPWTRIASLVDQASDTAVRRGFGGELQQLDELARRFGEADARTSIR